MFDRIKADIQEILNCLIEAQSKQDNAELKNITDRLRRLLRMLKTLEDKPMPDDLNARINIQENLLTMQESLDTIKSDLNLSNNSNDTQSKNVKKARSLHADNHSGTIDRLSKLVFEHPEKLADIEKLIPVRTDDKGKLTVSARLAFDNLPNVIFPQSLADPFNRAVLDSALSLFLAGNTHFTAESIYYEMTGNNRRSQHPNREILKDIVKAIEILSLGRVFIDATNEAKAKGYKFQQTHFEGYLLPLDGLHVVLMNGVKVDAYEFLKEPVLFSYAKQKGQVLTCSIDMLALPESLNMTRDNVILQRYLIERIEGMKNPHNNLGCVILYESIYEALGKQEASRVMKGKIRDKVKAFLDNWKDLAYIAGYSEIVEGRLIRSIRIDLFENKKLKN